MDTIGDNLGEKYAAKAIARFFETAVTPKITNTDYERYLSGGGASICKVKTWGDLLIKDYTRGSAMNCDDPTESEAEIDPDQQKGLYFEVDSLDEFEDYVNSPWDGLRERGEGQLIETVDAYVLGLYADAASGNRVATDYTTGNITITVTSGACAAGGSASWASGMVGLGLKATGHSKWYRIKTYTNASTIVIENDSDDDTQSYDGGAITAAAYTIEAYTVLTVTTATIVTQIDSLAEKLDQNKIPKANRWLVVNSKIAHLLRRSTELTMAVESAYKDVVQRGLLGWISGFEIYQNEQVSGNNTTGYYIMAGHISAITFVMEYKEAKFENDITGEFGKRFKTLWVYGAKVADERRKALAYLFCKV